MRPLKLIAVAVLALALLGASNAAGAAKPKNVPPGVSGQNQYTETLPGPAGNGPTRHLKSETEGSSPTGVLGEKNAQALNALGPEGQAAARLAAETSPEQGGRQGKNSKHGKDGNQADAGSPPASGSGSSGIRQVLGQLTGTGGSNSGGMGWLLPLLIGASILVAVAYLFSRRRPAQP